MLIALILATLALVAIPGPNVALIVGNTLRSGYLIGVFTVLGTTLGVSIQLALVAVGLATLLSHAAELYVWARWIGAGYLIFLGVKAWIERPTNLDTESASIKSASNQVLHGLAYAMVNPKTLLFNAAFLPQFIGPDAKAFDWIAMSSIYILVLLIGDLAWVALSYRARQFLARFARLRSRLAGAILVISGAGLAIARSDG